MGQDHDSITKSKSGAPSWLTALGKGTGVVLDTLGYGSRREEIPRPAPFPWIPVLAIGGGTLLVFGMMTKKRGRKR